MSDDKFMNDAVKLMRRWGEKQSASRHGYVKRDEDQRLEEDKAGGGWNIESLLEDSDRAQKIIEAPQEETQEEPVIAEEAQTEEVVAGSSEAVVELMEQQTHDLKKMYTRGRNVEDGKKRGEKLKQDIDDKIKQMKSEIEALQKHRDDAEDSFYELNWIDGELNKFSNKYDQNGPQVDKYMGNELERYERLIGHGESHVDSLDDVKKKTGL